MSIAEVIELARLNQDLGLVLRSCKVLAAELGSNPLEDWLKWESEGYPRNIEVPRYRAWGRYWTGSFSGPFGAQLRNAPISIDDFPEELQGLFGIHECRESISTLECIVKRGESAVVLTNPSLAPMLGTSVYEGYNCVDVQGHFSTEHYVEVVNTVRNRVLDFLLELRKTLPLHSDTTPEITREDSQKVTQVFNSEVLHVYMPNGDQYNTGQAGAVGPNAYAHDLSFKQKWEAIKSGVNLSEVARELGKLRGELFQSAKNASDYEVMGNVAEAEKAASDGDGPKMLEFLKKGGQVILDKATDCGFAILTNVITNIL